MSKQEAMNVVMESVMGPVSAECVNTNEDGTYSVDFIINNERVTFTTVSEFTAWFAA